MSGLGQPILAKGDLVTTRGARIGTVRAVSPLEVVVLFKDGKVLSLPRAMLRKLVPLEILALEG